MATLDQQRAQYAWEKVNEAAHVDIEKYTNLAKATPSLVMNSGLMQTLAYLQAKDGREHSMLLKHLLQWLSTRFPVGGNLTFEMVMNTMHHFDSATYMQLTNETMALLRWIRQFADARKAME